MAKVDSKRYRARSSRYERSLNEWHLQLASAIEVATMLLREHLGDAEAQPWVDDCSWIVQARLQELVESCPFPVVRGGGR
jgi:hypothetical protein